MGKISICNPTNNRPIYYRHTLSTLSSCESRDSFRLVTSEEPTSESLHGIIDKAREYIEIERSINSHRLGPIGNFFKSIERALLHDDRFVYIEDDHILAKDALNFILFVDRTFSNDPNCFGASCFASNDHYPFSIYGNLCFKKSWFHAWGFFTWKDRWERYLAEKDSVVSQEMEDYGWDYALDDYVKKKGFYMVYPCVARVEHIGEEGVHKGHDKMKNEGPRRYWHGSREFSWKTFADFDCIDGLYDRKMTEISHIPTDKLWQYRIDEGRSFNNI